MKQLSTRGNQFIVGGEPLLLKGVGLGNWLNLEHFMLGLPGTETQVRQAWAEAFGFSAANEFWQKFYTVYTSEADIAYVKSLGMNHVRVPVHYQHFFDNTFECSTAIKQLDRLLGYCRQHGVWAIIDLHAVPGGQNPDWHSDNAAGRDSFWLDDKAQQRIVSLWGDIAEYYRDEPAIAGFDLINEPCSYVSGCEQSILRFFERCTEAIRKVNSRTVIFYTGNTYGRDFSFFENNLDSNSAFTFHLYPFLQIPEKLSGDHIDDAIVHSLNNDVSFQHLTERLKRPLWCGETGFQWHSQESQRGVGAFLEILEKRDVGWALWPLKDCGTMGLLTCASDGEWNNLCRKVDGGWVFFNLFVGDSLASAKQNPDPYHYYRWLADETTHGFTVMCEQLVDTTIDEWMRALDDFEFGRCRALLSLDDL